MKPLLISCYAYLSIKFTVGTKVIAIETHPPLRELAKVRHIGNGRTEASMINKSANRNIIFNSINVTAVNFLSGIFVGSNSQWYWKSYNKYNCGFGTVKGKNNLVQNSVNTVIDPDYIDTPILQIRSINSTEITG